MEPFDLDGPLHDGATVLEASAGTGKTWSITHLVLRLVAERGVPIDRILVVTFTRAATAELRSRVRARLSEALAAEADPIRRERLVRALTDYDEAAIATIHGFCQRVLQENAFESGAEFDLNLVGDAGEHLAQLAADYWLTLTHDLSARELSALGDSKVHIKDLVELGWAWLRTPDAALHPDPAPARSGFAAWDAARREACDAWRAHRDAAVGELERRRDGLYKNLRDDLESYVEGVDAWVEAGGDAGGDVKPLTFLSSHYLERKTLKSGITPRHELFQCFAETEAAARAFESDRAQWAVQVKRGFVHFLATRLPEVKRQRAEQTYDDLLQSLRDGLRDPTRGPLLRAAIRARLDAALIDEFQDTDPVQWEIFRELFLVDPPCPLYLIGDPKQAIYQFRGADIYAYLAAREAAHRERTLDRAWRSDEPLVRAMNHLFGRLDQPFHTDRIAYPEVQPQQPVRLRWPDGRPRAPLVVRYARRAPGERHPDSGAVSEQVAAEIADVLGAPPEIYEDGLKAWRRVGPSDLAVLVRQHRQAAAVADALAALGVPAVRHGVGDVFGEPEADDLLQLMRAIAAPGDRRAVRTLLMGPLVQTDAVEVITMEDGAWEAWIGRLRGWRMLWLDKGFVQAIRKALHDLDVPARLAGASDGRRRVTNLAHLVERLHEQSADHPRELDRLVAWLAARIATAGEALPDADKLRLETDEPAVEVVTIHAAKGLEWPLVWCPYLWGSGSPDARHTVYHDPDPPFAAHLDIALQKPRAVMAQAGQEQRSEDRRLAYVALTRARHRCVVTWGPFYGSWTSPLLGFFHETTRGKDDDTLIAEVERAVAGAGGAIAVEPYATPRGRPVERTQPEPWRLQVALYERDVPLDTLWRRASFTALTHSRQTIEEEDGVDRDAIADDVAVEPAPVPDDPPVPLADLPGGARMGTFLHEVLEHTDFAASEDALRSAAASIGARYGVDPAHAPAIASALHGMLRVPLDPDVGALAGVPLADRLDEMAFDLALPDQRLSARALGAAIDAHHTAGSPLPADYGARVSALGFPPLRGFLTGRIDLVFRRGERYFVADWKSNWLGERPGHYAADRLTEAMVHSHYPLQALLYAVAVHRFLGLRVAGYDYDRHFGGIYYLFLRGMVGGDRGIFRWRPPRPLIEAVSALLSVEGRS